MDLKPGRKLTLAAVAGAAYVVGRRKGGRAEPATSGRVSLEKGSSAEAPGPPTRPEIPGVDAETPTQIPAQGWKQILKRAWKEQNDDNIGLIAAGVAYYAFTALFPALIAAVTLYGLFADPQTVSDQAAKLTKSLPADTASVITKQLSSIATTSNSALGVGLVVSLLGALFSASGGVGNVIKAVNIAYDEEETRGFLKLRGLALLLTFGAIVFVVVAIGLIAVLPALFDNIGLGSFGTLIANVVRWVALIVFMLIALAVLYRYAPDRDAPKFRWVGLGAVVATLLWVVASAGLSIYVSNFGSYGKTYGALAGVIVLLLWLYVTAFIVLLGAEINSESEQQTEKDSTEGPAVPMGERRAVKADSVAG